MAIVALSLKMYFERWQTLDYCHEVVRLLKKDEELNEQRRVTMAILPDFLSLAEAARILSPTNIRVGAQDLCADDRGAFTGEVSGHDIAALSGSIVEIGHIERKLLYHEDRPLIARKVRAAWRNSLTPLLCVGEQQRVSAEMASDLCIEQIREFAGSNPEAPLWVAYEPLWAIGADNPAPTEYVREVCSRIKDSLHARREAKVIYGGSAGPGLLTQLWPAVDGLFLGRFAHKPEAFVAVAQEALALEEQPVGSTFQMA